MRRELLISIFAVSILLCGCEYKINQNKGEEELALSVSTDTVVLKQRESSSQAIELVWTSGTNHGTGSAIAYELQIDEPAAPWVYHGTLPHRFVQGFESTSKRNA